MLQYWRSRWKLLVTTRCSDKMIHDLWVQWSREYIFQNKFLLLTARTHLIQLKRWCLTQRDFIPMFFNFHNRKPARSYCRFSNFSQYQLTPWWRHDLDMFSAVVAFREGTFHEINNADWISNVELWWLFVVRLNKFLNKQSRVELLVIWSVMPLTYRQCNDRDPGIIVDTLNLKDRAPVDFV